MLFLIPAAFAQSTDLSYDDALQRALEANPELLSADADVRAAAGGLLSAQGTFEPSLGASYGYTNDATQDFFPPSVYYDTQSTSTEWGTSVSSFLPTGTSMALSWNNTDQFSDYISYLNPETPDDVLTQESRDVYISALTASVTQSLLQGFKTTYNLSGVRSARRALTSAEATLIEQRQQVLASTAEGYWGLYYQSRLVEIATETLNLTKEERRVVLARIDRGDLAPVERSRVEAAVLSSESALLDAQNAAATALESLLLMMGEDPSDALSLTTPPRPVVSHNFDEGALTEEAMGTNPGLMQLRIAEEIAEANLSDANHARLPDLSGTARYTRYGQESDFSGATSELVSGDLRTWYVGADLTVPLGNRVDRGLMAQRVAELEAARTGRLSAERALAQQIRAQVRAVRSAQLQVQLSEANLKAAEDTLAADQALRDAGRAIQKDVLESIRDFNNARNDAEKSRSDYNLALIELSRLRGAL